MLSYNYYFYGKLFATFDCIICKPCCSFDYSCMKYCYGVSEFVLPVFHCYMRSLHIVNVFSLFLMTLRMLCFMNVFALKVLFEK